MIKIIKHFKELHVKEPILIFGMDGGMGHIAKVVGDYLIDQFKLKRIYSIYGHFFPSIVSVEDHVVKLVGAKLYYGATNNKEIIVLSGETQPYDDRGQYEFSKILFRILKKLNVKLIITVGGYDVGTEPEEPKVYISGSNRKIVEEFVEKDKDLKIDFNSNIVGLAGLLIGLGRIYKIPGIVLLAETIGHPMFVGLRGARSILNTLNKILDLNIDLSKLEEEIKEQETLAKSLLKQKKKKITPPRPKITYIG